MNKPKNIKKTRGKKRMDWQSEGASSCSVFGNDLYDSMSSMNFEEEEPAPPPDTDGTNEDELEC